MNLKLLLLMTFLSSPMLNAVEIFDAVFSQIRNNQMVQTLSRDQLTKLIQIGISERDNIFELLNKVIVYLDGKNLRARINGEDFRAIEKAFYMGGDRIEALLPASKIKEIYLGAPLAENLPMIDIFLTEKHSQFLELADFALERHYGFKTVRPFFFEEAFGVRVIQMYVGLDVSRIEVENTAPIKNNIAIHVSLFPKPKRWTIPSLDPNRNQR